MGTSVESKKRASERALAIYHARRAVWFAENGPCTKCGSSENLQADHINPRTKITHKVWSWAEDRMLAELSKCQVLCASCHRQKTKVDMAAQKVHGTPTGYTYYGCRCPLCRNAGVAYSKKYKILRRWGKKLVTM